MNPVEPVPALAATVTFTRLCSVPARKATGGVPQTTVVDDDHAAVLQLAEATIEDAVCSREPKLSPSMVTEFTPLRGTLVGDEREMDGASNENAFSIVPLIAATVIPKTCVVVERGGAEHVTDETDVHELVEHNDSATELLIVHSTAANERPDTVMDALPLVGVFSSPYEATGASNEKPRHCVPATAPTVTTVDMPLSIRGALDAQLTDVEDVQDAVLHDACASSAVALKP